MLVLNSDVVSCDCTRVDVAVPVCYTGHANVGMAEPSSGMDGWHAPTETNLCT